MEGSAYLYVRQCCIHQSVHGCNKRWHPNGNGSKSHNAELQVRRISREVEIGYWYGSKRMTFRTATMTYPRIGIGSRIVLGIMFFTFWDFCLICCSVHFPGNLQHFGAGSCYFNGIATLWSSNLSFPWYVQHFGAQTFHVEWYFATRVHLGFV